MISCLAQTRDPLIEALGTACIPPPPQDGNWRREAGDPLLGTRDQPHPRCGVAGLGGCRVPSRTCVLYVYSGKGYRFLPRNKGLGGVRLVQSEVVAECAVDAR